MKKIILAFVILLIIPVLTSCALKKDNKISNESENIPAQQEVGTVTPTETLAKARGQASIIDEIKNYPPTYPKFEVTCENTSIPWIRGDANFTGKAGGVIGNTNFGADGILAAQALEEVSVQPGSKIKLNADKVIGLDKPDYRIFLFEKNKGNQLIPYPSNQDELIVPKEAGDYLFSCLVDWGKGDNKISYWFKVQVNTNGIKVVENTPANAAPGIDVQTPVTLSNNDISSYVKSNQSLRIKMVSGRYAEDWNPGAFMGPNWEGQFVIDLVDENGKTIAETDISKAFSEPLVFKSSFNLEFDDYNNDGDLDFTIGQYASSNGRVYKIFTLRKDGKVEELPVKDHPDLFISNSTGYYSTRLNKINGTTFEIEYYNNAEGTFHDFYKWDGKQFILLNSQKMTRDDALTGSSQDKNKLYTYVKYGKSEEGFMEFTKTGAQIEGYVEIATINKNYQVEIKKYPFKGTLLNNYISITFPGASWLNSSKGITWIGNFDYQETFFYVPVDAAIDAGGVTQLPFNKGTMDDFNSYVSELKDRAQEWKREDEKSK